jgi:DNA anti-recombination protein RmuC
MGKTEKKKRLEMLRRQLANLKKNFEDMVTTEEEIDLMLDWMNKIRQEIREIEKELE